MPIAWKDWFLAYKPATASDSDTLSGTATGTVNVPATASFTATLSDVATGTVNVPATAELDNVLSESAVGDISGLAPDGFTLTGVATGRDWRRTEAALDQ